MVEPPASECAQDRHVVGAARDRGLDGEFRVGLVLVGRHEVDRDAASAEVVEVRRRDRVAVANPLIDSQAERGRVACATVRRDHERDAI